MCFNSRILESEGSQRQGLLKTIWSIARVAKDLLKYKNKIEMYQEDL